MSSPGSTSQPRPVDGNTMQVKHAICKIGPRSPGITKAMEPAATINDAVRTIACTGNVDLLLKPPPVWLHPEPEAWAQKLYGGVRASHVPEAPYVPGKSGKHERHEEGVYLVGGALLDPPSFEGHALPALVWQDYTTGQLQAHVYNTPMTKCENELYLTAESDLEIAWKGSDMASAHANLREQMASNFREGLSSMPGFLFSDDPNAYHLVRPGPVPFLHMRGPRTEEEVEILEKSILAYMVTATTPAPDSSPSLKMRGYRQHPRDLKSNEGPPKLDAFLAPLSGAESNLRTWFDRGPQPNIGSDSADLALIASKYAKYPTCAVIAYVLVNAPGEMDESYRSAIHELANDIRSFEISATTRCATTRNTLSSLASSSWHCINTIKLGAAKAGHGHVVASAVFAASDVGLAVREVTTDQPWQMLLNIAERVCEKQAMLCVKLTAANTIGQMRLVNTAVAYAIGVDSAARLVNEPWLRTVVMQEQTPTEGAAFFLMETSSGYRQTLSVCESVRQTYGLDAQKHLRPPPAPPADFLELDKRIQALETLLKTPPVPPPPVVPPPAPAEPARSSIPYTSPELERLKAAEKKWSSMLGKRPR